jgi:hypothetical protein
LIATENKQRETVIKKYLKITKLKIIKMSTATTDTLELITGFPRRVSEATGIVDLPPEYLAEEEAHTGDLLAARLASVLLGMLTEEQLLQWRTIDTSTTDPHEALIYLIQTVPDIDAIVAEEIELLFAELTNNN